MLCAVSSDLLAQLLCTGGGISSTTVCTALPLASVCAGSALSRASVSALSGGGRRSPGSAMLCVSFGLALANRTTGPSLLIPAGMTVMWSWSILLLTSAPTSWSRLPAISSPMFHLAPYTDVATFFLTFASRGARETFSTYVVTFTSIYMGSGRKISPAIEIFLPHSRDVPPYSRFLISPKESAQFLFAACGCDSCEA